LDYNYVLMSTAEIKFRISIQLPHITSRPQKLKAFNSILDLERRR